MYTRPRFVYAATLLLAAICSGMLLWSFHDVYWSRADDGVFAYLAERLSTGAVLGVDVVDMHPGYHALVNAFMFDLFGSDVVVMRYPLILLGVIQAMIVAHLLRRRGIALAVLGGIATTTFGYLHFTNPSPSWYALFFAFVSILLLSEYVPSIRRHLALGFLLGLCFMFRHPSAIFLAYGIILALVVEYAHHTPGTTRHDRLFTRTLLLGLAAGLLLYNILMFDLVGFLVFGIWPLILLIVLARAYVVPVAVFGKVLMWMVAGAFVACVPMLIYQGVWGDVSFWFTSTFVHGTNIVSVPFFKEMSYLSYPMHALTSFLFEGGGVYAFQRLLYWCVLLITPIAIGGYTIWAAMRAPSRLRYTAPVLCVAVCYGYVSYYYQIPFYLAISMPVYVLACVVVIPRTRPHPYIAVVAVLLSMNLLSLVNDSMVLQVLQYGDTLQYAPALGLSVRMPADEHRAYAARVDAVHHYVPPHGELYVFPYSPDLYFTTKTYTRFPTYGSTYAVTSEETLATHAAQLIDTPPDLIMYLPTKLALRPYDEALYDLIRTSGRFEQATTVDQYIFLIPVQLEAENAVASVQE